MDQKNRVLSTLGKILFLERFPVEILALIAEFSKMEEFRFDFDNCLVEAKLHVYEITFGGSSSYAEDVKENKKLTYTHFPTNEPDIVKGTSLEGRNLTFYSRAMLSNTKSYLGTDQTTHQTSGVRHYRLATVDGRFYCGATILNRQDAVDGKKYYLQDCGFSDPSTISMTQTSAYVLSDASVNYTRMGDCEIGDPKNMVSLCRRCIVNMSLDYDNWKIVFRSAYDPELSFSMAMLPVSSRDQYKVLTKDCTPHVTSLYDKQLHEIALKKGTAERIPGNKHRVRPKNCSIVPSLYTWRRPLAVYSLTEFQALTPMNSKERQFWKTWMKTMRGIGDISGLKKENMMTLHNRWLKDLKK